jgi:shikimate kinase
MLVEGSRWKKIRNMVRHAAEKAGKEAGRILEAIVVNAVIKAAETN